MKITGFIIIFLSLLNTSIITFAYRDISISLVIMFLITIVGLPIGTYLINRNSVKLDVNDNDEIEVAGLFSIGNSHQSS